MDAGEIAGLIAAGAFLMLVIVLAVPILKLGRTVDAATRAINDLTDRTGPLLGNVNETVEEREHRARPGPGLFGRCQRAARQGRHDHRARGARHRERRQPVHVVAAAAANPLVKVAAFGYGLRKAVANRRRADEDREVRATLKQRRKAGR